MNFSNQVDEMEYNLSLSVGNTIEFGYKIIHNYLISLFTVLRVQIPLHRITDSASNGSVFPVVTEHFSTSSDHAFL